MDLFERGRHTAIKQRISAIEELLEEIGRRLEKYPPSEAHTAAEKQMLAMALNLDNLDANADVMAGMVEEEEEPEIDVVYDRPEMHELTQPASLEPSGPWPTDSEPDYSGYYEQEEQPPEDVENQFKKFDEEKFWNL